MRQIQFEKTPWKHRYCHGGILRNKRRGRSERPLSTKHPIHLVLKANRDTVRGGFRTPRRFQLIHRLSSRYAKRFFVKIEQMSLQGDHIHLVVRVSRRSTFQNFLRVFPGQIAQRFQAEELMTTTTRATANPRNRQNVTDTTSRESHHTKKAFKKMEKLWKYRPYTRVVQGLKAYGTVQNYVQLNEQEARGNIPYRKTRLRGLPPDEWELLWS